MGPRSTLTQTDGHTGTMTTAPYETADYAARYDESYLFSGFNRDQTAYAVGLLGKIARRRPGLRWLDAACGTGYHLRAAPGRSSRTGVDRSVPMLDVARARPGRNVQFHLGDVRQLGWLGPFDLVTNFWYGYIHQPSLDAVLEFFDSMVEAVAPGGELLMDICNPAGTFDRVPWGAESCYGPELFSDALIWSYRGLHGSEYRNCIAPHPGLILDRVGPRFASYRWRYYPIPDAAPEWQRRALHLRGKIAGANHA